LTANAKVAAVNPASSETVETEGRQAKQLENTSILLAKKVEKNLKCF
jgi:hypothetical protein